VAPDEGRHAFGAGAVFGEGHGRVPLVA
jgi:hypothetical protein